MMQTSRMGGRSSMPPPRRMVSSLSFNNNTVARQLSAGSTQQQGRLTEQEKKEKEQFLMFTRVLMKYLEQRDTNMHTKAQATIKECYEKNKSGDPNFHNLTTSMKVRLRQTVGGVYWKKAHEYLDHFLKQKTTSKAATEKKKAEKKKAEEVEVEKRKAREVANAEQKKRNLNYAELIKQKIINLGDIDLVDDDLDEVIKTIEQNTVLEELRLWGNKLTLSDGKLVDAIAKNNTLKVLHLSNNNISVEGAKQLADALKENSTLEELYLSGNNIGDEGAKYIAEMLAINKTLQEIRLLNNNIGGPGGRKLAEALGSNHNIEYLGLSGNNISRSVSDRIDVVCKKNKQIVTLKQSLAKKDKQLEGKDAVIAKIFRDIKSKGDIVRKDQENEKLKNELADANREVVTARREKDTAIAEKEDALKSIASMKADITRKEEELLASIKRILNPVADDNDEPPSKRARTTGDTPMEIWDKDTPR